MAESIKSCENWESSNNGLKLCSKSWIKNTSIYTYYNNDQTSNINYLWINVANVYKKKFLNMWLQNDFEPIVKADKTKVEKSKERAHWINALKYVGLGPNFVICNFNTTILGNFQEFFSGCAFNPE